MADDHSGDSAAHLASEERRLWRSEEKFRLLVESVKDYAIFLIDRHGYVQTWNIGAERIKGWREDEIVGQHISLFYPAQNVQRPAELLEEAAARGRTQDEGWRVRKDGSRFWAEVIITALTNPSGEVYGFAKVTRDLTARRKLELERLRAERARESVRLRDEFLSIAAHELKTPLTALQLHLQSIDLDAAGLPPKISEKIASASRSVDRLAELIESLFDVSHIAKGKLALECFSYDLADSVLATVDGLRAAARAGGCELITNVDGPIHGVWDRPRLEQVLTGLLCNAIKYGAGGKVTVDLRASDHGVTLEVNDQGPGIAEGDLVRIFGRFERASPVRNYGGMGLGLYVVREIVLAHGGEIRARNRPGGGTSFVVSLPLDASAPIRAEEPHA